MPTKTDRPCCSHGTERSSMAMGAIVPGAGDRLSIVHVLLQNQSVTPTVLTGVRLGLSSSLCYTENAV